MSDATYALPDGFTVTARGEADSDWNGYPVPILAPGQYAALVTHLDDDDADPYAAEYVHDGKVTSGYYADGLTWALVDDDACEDDDAAANPTPQARPAATGERAPYARPAAVAELMASPFPLGRL